MNKRIDYMRARREANKKPCVTCNEVMVLSTSTNCMSCAQFLRAPDITLGEAIYKNHHRSSAYALIRSRARNICKFSPCHACGYDKHTEVCHLTAIGDFPLDTKISVINSKENLIRLCPNCHWEYDKGRLSLDI